MKQGAKVLVKQTRGLSGRNQAVRRTLQALGLGRIGKSQEHSINPALWGMLRRVNHMIEVIEIK